MNEEDQKNNTQIHELFFLNENIRDFDSVIIYGIGRWAHGAFLKLLQRNIQVDCFIDSNPDNYGKEFLGIPVKSIYKIGEDVKKKSAIIVGGKYYFEVAKELEKMGFRYLFFDYGNEVDVVHLTRE